MPIIGLTHNSTPNLPHLGELRKGGEKPAGNKPGEDLRHFRYTSKIYPSVQAFYNEFGEEPNHLTVLLPYRTVGENFPTWREAWTASRLQHRCDGKTCVLSLNKDGRTYSQEPKPCPGSCKQIGRLTIIVPELLHAGFVGTVTVLTTSLHDIMEIHGNLLGYQQMRGDLRGIEFILSRIPRMIPTPDGPRREKWLINITAHHQWVVAQLEGMKQVAMLPATAGADLPDMLPPDIVDEETGEITPGEYTIKHSRQLTAVQVVQKTNGDLFEDKPTLVGRDPGPMDWRSQALKAKDLDTFTAALYQLHKDRFDDAPAAKLFYHDFVGSFSPANNAEALAVLEKELAEDGLFEAVEAQTPPTATTTPVTAKIKPVQSQSEPSGNTDWDGKPNPSWRNRLAANPKPTVGTVASMVPLGCGYYRNEDHVMACIEGMAKSEKLSVDDALALYDQLIERAMARTAVPA